MSSSTSVQVEGGELPEELTHLALGLLEASRTADNATIKALLDKGAPAWYQDTALGWSCLHYAAERRDPELLRLLLQGGAVWNAVDKWGRTAGEISLSLGDKEGWEVIRNEGVRSGISST
jgi:protein arginine N-methyltransferase 2